MDKISIIIPVYNASKYLKKCIDSIINQTYRNIEIICINDGSVDNSLEILEKYKEKDDRIIIIDKENQGVSAARNDGIKSSTGNYITFVDSDDWLELDAIDTLYKTLIKQQVDVVRGNYYKNYNYDRSKTIGETLDFNKTKLYTTDNDFGVKVIDRLIDGRIQGYVVLLLIRRECVFATSLFIKELKLMEDLVFYVELLNNIQSIYFLDKPLYHYYINSNSCTQAKEYYQRNMYNIEKVNKHLKRVLKNGKFYNEKRIEKINTLHANSIIDSFFNMYKQSYKTNLELKNTIEELLSNNEINLLLKSANLKLLPIHLKISMCLILNKKYNMLFAFYKIRSLMSKLKHCIIRKK